MPYSPDHTRVTNMLAPRTPAESDVVDSVEVSADSGDGAREGEPAAQAAAATAGDAVEQVTEAKETESAEGSKAEATDSTEAAREETAPASAETPADVAQPEGKTESDDSEEAKT